MKENNDSLIGSGVTTSILIKNKTNKNNHQWSFDSERQVIIPVKSEILIIPDCAKNFFEIGNKKKKNIKKGTLNKISSINNSHIILILRIVNKNININIDVEHHHQQQHQYQH